MQLTWVTTLIAVPVLSLFVLLARVIFQVLQLGVGGAAFLEKQREVKGDAFQVGAFPPHLVFLFDPAAIRQFFTAPTDEIDFRMAVEHFTQRIFQLSNEGFFPRHQRLWRGLRNLLTGSSVPLRAAQLSRLMQDELQAAWPAGQEVDLMETVKTLLFDTVAQLLFGQQFVTTHGREKLRTAFFDFEEDFERGASPFPHFLQPRFCAARLTLLTAFRQSVVAGHFAGSIVAELLVEGDIADSEAPNILLAVLWAAMANSVPASFWTLSVLLLPSSRHLAARIRAEAAALGGPSLEQQAVQMALDPRSFVRLCGDESIRLFSPSIDVRVAARDLVLPAGPGRSLRVRRGSILAVSPFLSHRDTRLFPEAPGAFRPQRFAAGCGGGGSVPAGKAAASAAATAATAAAAAGSSGSGAPEGQQAISFGRSPNGDGSSGSAAVSSGGLSDGNSSGAATCGDGAGEAAVSGEGSAVNGDRGEAADELGAIPGVSQTGMAFGGGRFRCPGRAFAEMEVALFAANVLLRYDLELLPPQQQQVSAAGSSGGGGADAKEPWWQRLLCPAAGLQAGWKDALAPDAAEFLPDIQHQRLVGMKWPAATCIARVTAASG